MEQMFSILHSNAYQNPNEDTEWNDVLRAKGIIPEKDKGITEEQIVQMMEKSILDLQQTSKLGKMINWF